MINMNENGVVRSLMVPIQQGSSAHIPQLQITNSVSNVPATTTTTTTLIPSVSTPQTNIARSIIRTVNTSSVSSSGISPANAKANNNMPTILVIPVTSGYNPSCSSQKTKVVSPQTASATTNLIGGVNAKGEAFFVKPKESIPIIVKQLPSVGNQGLVSPVKRLPVPRQQAVVTLTQKPRASALQNIPLAASSQNNTSVNTNQNYMILRQNNSVRIIKRNNQFVSSGIAKLNEGSSIRNNNTPKIVTVQNSDRSKVPTTTTTNRMVIVNKPALLPGNKNVITSNATNMGTITVATTKGMGTNVQLVFPSTLNNLPVSGLITHTLPNVNSSKNFSNVLTPKIVFPKPANNLPASGLVTQACSTTSSSSVTSSCPEKSSPEKIVIHTDAELPGVSINQCSKTGNKSLTITSTAYETLLTKTGVNKRIGIKFNNHDNFKDKSPIVVFSRNLSSTSESHKLNASMHFEKQVGSVSTSVTAPGNTSTSFTQQFNTNILNALLNESNKSLNSSSSQSVNPGISLKPNLLPDSIAKDGKLKQVQSISEGTGTSKRIVDKNESDDFDINKIKTESTVPHTESWCAEDTCDSGVWKSGSQASDDDWVMSDVESDNSTFSDGTAFGRTIHDPEVRPKYGTPDSKLKNSKSTSETENVSNSSGKKQKRKNIPRKSKIQRLRECRYYGCIGCSAICHMSTKRKQSKRRVQKQIKESFHQYKPLFPELKECSIILHKVRKRKHYKINCVAKKSTTKQAFRRKLMNALTKKDEDLPQTSASGEAPKKSKYFMVKTNAGTFLVPTDKQQPSMIINEGNNFLGKPTTATVLNNEKSDGAEVEDHPQRLIKIRPKVNQAPSNDSADMTSLLLNSNQTSGKVVGKLIEEIVRRNSTSTSSSESQPKINSLNYQKEVLDEESCFSPELEESAETWMEMSEDSSLSSIGQRQEIGKGNFITVLKSNDSGMLDSAVDMDSPIGLGNSKNDNTLTAESFFNAPSSETESDLDKNEEKPVIESKSSRRDELIKKLKESLKQQEQAMEDARKTLENSKNVFKNIMETDT